jgi:hypothetical protein
VIDLIDQAAKVGFVRPASSSTTSRFLHSDQSAFVGYPVLGSGQRTPLPTASDSFTATNPEGDQGISKVDSPLENTRELSINLDNNQMLSEDSSVEPHSIKKVSKKRRSITKDEAETLIKEYIESHGNPSIRDVCRETGLSQGRVCASEPWKSLMQRRSQTKYTKSVTARNLRFKSIDSFGFIQKEIDKLEIWEILEINFLQNVNPNEASDYQLSNPEVQRSRLEEFVERTKKEVERYCEENPTSLEARSLQEIKSQGNLELWFILADQIREKRTERVLRKRSQDEE